MLRLPEEEPSGFSIITGCTKVVMMSYGGPCDGGNWPGLKRIPGMRTVLHARHRSAGFGSKGGGGGGIGRFRYIWIAARASESLARFDG